MGKKFVNRYTKYKLDWKEKRLKSLEGEYLFSDGIYPTKIRVEDLPSSFVAVRDMLCPYYNTEGITNLVYVPNLMFNHLFKYDYLYITYSDNTKLGKVYDEIISGYSIIDFLRKAEETGYDISSIKEQIEMKRLHFKEKFPSEYSMSVQNDEPFF